LPDIFISSARPNEPHARLAGEALRAAGYTVWRDDELPAHRPYSEVIEERITSAKTLRAAAGARLGLPQEANA
jgi:adenylate cyclase